MIKEKGPKIEDLPYHNQLLVHRTIKNNEQMTVASDLIKTGICSPGALDLFTAIYSTFQPTEEEKSKLLQLIDKYILYESTKKTVIDLIEKLP